MNKLANSVVTGMLLFTSFMATVHGQGSTASLAGVIRDEQSLVVPGAAVTLSAIENTFSRTVTTDPNGAFEFAGLLPGEYRMRSNWQGSRQRRRTSRSG